MVERFKSIFDVLEFDESCVELARRQSGGGVVEEEGGINCLA